MKIKFRAWKPLNGGEMEMDYNPEIFADNYDGIIDINAVFANPIRFYEDNAINHNAKIKFMQFSGVKDVFDKEIYEGDIVTFDTTCGNAGNYVVKLDKGTFEPLDEMTLATSRNLKVIGNIYQNPELVEVKEDED
ncbi:YopX family protein [Lacticaseibacillus saniviri]